ncbi:BCL2/adenovirus E1B 19 kDa protein-interacting protein 3 [Macrosteles quadrilineatus]|uniref:BCL2/adenovirus E1B 19 kDa protein-interacting protein 3 n=1 Tax=Macrosteles quadrilineatus TaxID=74068 RepID=UPI0023E1729D|nr:BCL2/adenovirus E1B 19 kDa protein-interacting protein 3 [Macrosteles quadrilineatus]
MTSKRNEDALGESWVEFSGQTTPVERVLSPINTGHSSPERMIPLPFASGEEYLRLLHEAQRESYSGSYVSSKNGSPKSPPNSPNTELANGEEFKGVYINYTYKDGDFVAVDRNTDWIWDWSSRPDQTPPKDWKFKHPKRRTYSIRTAKVGNNSLFSKEVLYTLFLTNVLSLLLGTGFGMWLSRRGLTFSPISLD